MLSRSHKVFFSINAAVIWQYCNKDAFFLGHPFLNICKINYYLGYNAVILRPISITDGSRNTLLWALNMNPSYV